MSLQRGDRTSEIRSWARPTMGGGLANIMSNRNEWRRHLLRGSALGWEARTWVGVKRASVLKGGNNQNVKIQAESERCAPWRDSPVWVSEPKRVRSMSKQRDPRDRWGARAGMRRLTMWGSEKTCPAYWGFRGHLGHPQGSGSAKVKVLVAQ